MQVVQTRDHEMQPIKGYVPGFPMLDKTAPMDATDLATLTAWPSGRVGYLSSSGTIKLADGSALSTEMPLYLWQGGDNWGTITQGVGVGGRVDWQNIVPVGTITGLVATGGYEIQTTEFDATQTYAPNTFLTTTVDDDDVPGLLTPGTAYTDWICGVASLHCLQRWDQQGSNPTSAKGVNAFGKDVLTFWTYFLPKQPRA